MAEGTIYIAKLKDKDIYVGANKRFVEGAGEALTTGSEVVCWLLIDNFVKDTSYTKENFEIVKLERKD